MKIALIGQPSSDLYPPVVASGSIEIWTFQIARRLAQRDDVTVYSTITRDDDSGREVYENVTYRRFPADLDRYVAGALNHLARVIVLRRPYFNFWSRFYWSRFYYRGLALQTGRDLGRWQPDIVHLHNFASFAPVLRALCPSAKLVLHMHCDWLTLLDERVTRRYLRAVDQVVGCSNFVVDPIREMFPELPARTVYNGVDLEHFRPQPELRSPDDQGVEILFVGRISPEKGIHTLGRAFNLLAPRHPTLRLRIVGPRGELPPDFLITITRDPMIRALTRFYPGDYEVQCRSLIDPAFRDRVKFEGAIPHSELPVYFNRGAILVQPSVWEPFGIPAIEAMACGLPVVAARTGGLAESIVDGENGLLIPREDPPALADALHRLIANPAERRRMGTASRARAVAEFGYDRVIETLRACYAELIAAESLSGKSERAQYIGGF